MVAAIWEPSGPGAIFSPMAEIAVESIGDHRYRVTVTEGGSTSRHEVTVGPDQATSLGGGAAVEELIEASFRFLLDRERKESILGRFELEVISRYFPEYESRIGEYL